MKLFIGTSGYQYNFWKNSFYQNNKNYLKFYSENFNIVEINYTFYKIPSEEIVKKWFEDTPNDFRFVIKMNRFVTHYKKLVDINEILKQFFNSLTNLKYKLVGILFQFGSNFGYNDHNFIKLKNLKPILKKNLFYAFEFRNQNWFNSDNTINLFKKNKWVFVFSNYPKNWFDNQSLFIPKLGNKFITSSKILYLRLHGTKDKYIGSYNQIFYKKLRKLIEESNVANVYIFFNNTDSISTKQNLPDAIFNAFEFKNYMSNI